MTNKGNIQKALAVAKYRRLQRLEQSKGKLNYDLIPEEPMIRNCLRCRVDFVAEGRFNRKCSGCQGGYDFGKYIV